MMRSLVLCLKFKLILDKRTTMETECSYLPFELLNPLVQRVQLLLLLLARSLCSAQALLKLFNLEKKKVRNWGERDGEILDRTAWYEKIVFDINSFQVLIWGEIVLHQTRMMLIIRKITLQAKIKIIGLLVTFCIWTPERPSFHPSPPIHDIALPDNSCYCYFEQLINH